MQSYIRGVRGYGRDVKLFLLYNLLSNVGIGVFQLLFNLYLIELGYDESFIGEFQSISTLSMAAVALSIGVLVNRFGVWKTVTSGLVFFLITSVLASIITNQAALLVMAALSGAGTAFLFVPTMPFIVELTGRHERHGVAALAFSLNSLSITVGSLIGGFGARGIGTLFDLDVPSAEAYRYTLIAGLLLAGFALLPLLGMTEDRKRALPVDEQATGMPGADASPTPEDSPPAHDRLHCDWRTDEPWGRRSLSVLQRLPGDTRRGSGDRHHLRGGWVDSGGSRVVLALGGAPLRFVESDRHGPPLFRSPIYLLLMMTPALPVAIIAHIFRTTSVNMAWPIDSTYISEILPAKARASVFSFRSGAWNLGWSLSSLVAGYAIVRYGYNVSFAAYILFMSLAMGLFYVYFSRAAAPEPRPAPDAIEPVAAAK